MKQNHKFPKIHDLIVANISKIDISNFYQETISKSMKAVLLNFLALKNVTLVMVDKLVFFTSCVYAGSSCNKWGRSSYTESEERSFFASVVVIT